MGKKTPPAPLPTKDRSIVVAIIGAVAVVLAAAIAAGAGLLGHGSPMSPTDPQATTAKAGPYPVTLDVEADGDGAVNVTPTVLQAAPAGLTYWLILRFDNIDAEHNPHSEYYPYAVIDDTLGPHRATNIELSGADPEVKTSVVVYQVDAKTAALLEADHESSSNTETQAQRVQPPCRDCLASRAVPFVVER